MLTGLKKATLSLLTNTFERFTFCLKKLKKHLQVQKELYHNFQKYFQHHLNSECTFCIVTKVPQSKELENFHIAMIYYTNHILHVYLPPTITPTTEKMHGISILIIVHEHYVIVEKCWNASNKQLAAQFPINKY
mgnify:CR=1 FL=1